MTDQPHNRNSNHDSAAGHRWLTTHSMKPIILELACGPDDRRCRVEFTFRPDRDEFIDCSLLIQLPPQLDLRLSGFLFYEQSVLRLLEALESERVGLASPVTDSDSLLTITADELPDWVEWTFEWTGIYPAFPPFNPDAPSNAKILILGLRAYHTHSECLPTFDAIPETTEAEHAVDATARSSIVTATST